MPLRPVPPLRRASRRLGQDKSPPAQTLAFAGDVMLGRHVNEAMRQHGFAYPWGDVLQLLYGVDLFFVNLECSLTSEAEPWHDGAHQRFLFRAGPAAVAALQLARVDFASLANNHSGDFGTAGLLETIDVLDHASITHAGAGVHLAAASKPAILGAGGWAISAVSFADHPIQWAAGPERPGINFVHVSTARDDFAVIEAAIAEARAQSELVVVSIHWGPNMRSHPTDEFRQFARLVVSAGADIFWGHSAHLVQGVEFWDGKLIMYDTGDFIDDYAVDYELHNDLSALFLVRVRPPAVLGVRAVPVRIRDQQVRLAHRQDARWFKRRFAALCADLGSDARITPSGVLVPAPPPLALPL